MIDALTSIEYWDAVIRVTTPIALAALACLLCSRVGMLYVAVEGVMIFAAFFAIAGVIWTGSVLLGVLFAILAGIFGNLAFVFLSIGMRMGDVVGGLVIHIGAVGLTGFLLEEFFPGGATISGAALNPIWPSIGWNFGDLFLHQQPLVYLVILGAILIRMAWTTKTGLIVRSGGESVRTAESLGVNVIKLRYAVLAVAGIPIGLAGASLALALAGAFDPNIGGGRGFIALVCVILGAWRPMWVLVAAVFFGSSFALQFRLDFVGDWIQILPFALTLVALGVLRWKGQGPADEGKDPREAF